MVQKELIKAEAQTMIKEESADDIAKENADQAQEQKQPLPPQASHQQHPPSQQHERKHSKRKTHQEFHLNWTPRPLENNHPIAVGALWFGECFFFLISDRIYLL